MRPRGVGLALTLSLAVVACGAAASDSGLLTLTEFSIDGTTQIGAGASAITAENLGEFPHTLVVADSAGDVVAVTDLIQPNETVDLEFGLSPGTYVFTCRIVAQKDDGSLVDHYEAGMMRVVEVAG